MIVADYVKCGKCGEKMYLVRGSDVCPLCRHKGGLQWADLGNEDNYEVEVNESEIANIDDYEDVINDDEKYLTGG